MRAITNKRYWIKNDDGEKVVVWSAWDAILGIPDGLVDKSALDDAIAAIQKPESPYPMITDQTALQNLANMGGD